MQPDDTAPLHPKPGDVINTRAGPRRVILALPGHSFNDAKRGGRTIKDAVAVHTHTAILLGPLPE